MIKSYTLKLRLGSYKLGQNGGIYTYLSKFIYSVAGVFCGSEGAGLMGFTGHIVAEDGDPIASIV